ncbi:hypothetical protein L7F22_005644 [Adiantum nelumboides]|nr:hypothetical protein [Adiantum nelumboides]
MLVGIAKDLFGHHVWQGDGRPLCSEVCFGQLVGVHPGIVTEILSREKLSEQLLGSNQAKHALIFSAGRQHRVFTGVSLIFPSACDPVLGKAPLVRTFWKETKVDFGHFEREAIEAYVKSREPMDKAGAYGIQVFQTYFFDQVLMLKRQGFVLRFSVLREIQELSFEVCF